LCQLQHAHGCQVTKNWHRATCPRFSYKLWLQTKIKSCHYFNQDMLDWLSEFQKFCPESCASSSMHMDARSRKTGIEPHVLVVHWNGSYTQEKHHYDRDMMQKMEIEWKLFFDYLGHLSVKNSQQMTLVILSWRNNDHAWHFRSIFFCFFIDLIFVMSCAFFLVQWLLLVVELWWIKKKSIQTGVFVYFFSSTPVWWTVTDSTTRTVSWDAQVWFSGKNRHSIDQQGYQIHNASVWWRILHCRLF
jgi:hypothetical protein